MMKTNIDVTRFGITDTALTKLSVDSGMPLDRICMSFLTEDGDADHVFVTGSDYDDDTYDGEYWMYDPALQEFIDMMRRARPKCKHCGK